MKGGIYRGNPHALPDPKEVIAYIVSKIPPLELSRVFANKIRRVDECLQAHEEYLQHFL
jgi:hypothetical protein